MFIYRPPKYRNLIFIPPSIINLVVRIIPRLGYS